jgi:hypothetical protein
VVTQHVNSYRECQPQNKVVFLKTHKCASSTIQNVLLRNALRNDLNVVLPMTGNYVGRYTPFNNAMLWGTPWDQAKLQYNIYCLHGIWNYTGVSGVMNRGDDGGHKRGFYFSILRDPIELFTSLWDYTKMSNFYGVSLETYALSPKIGRLADRRPNANLGRNQMLFDFGLDKQKLDNDDAIREKIAEIERTFDLLLVAEKFEESMVLLRDALCWTYEEVSYLKLNARQEGRKSQLSEKARAALKDWLWGDYMLYDHFRANFQMKLDRYGAAKMERERRILETANSNVAERCVIDTVDNSKLSDTYRTWGDGLVGYEVNEVDNPFCKYYGIAELAFIDELRVKQADRAGAKMAEEGRTVMEFDPTKFQPKKMMTKDGKPDLEMLKMVFAHKLGAAAAAPLVG